MSNKQSIVNCMGMGGVEMEVKSAGTGGDGCNFHPRLGLCFICLTVTFLV